MEAINGLEKGYRNWQIGSETPPKVCLCCGLPFDEGKRKRKGPYYGQPYIWVCEWCWRQPYLYFPDKDNKKE